METARRLMARLNLLCGLIAGFALAAMMAVGAADVVMTNLDLVWLPSRPVPATTEFTATMMVVAVFFALPLAQQSRSHIRITLARYATGGLGRVLEVVQHLMHGAFYALIAWFGWEVASHAYASGEFAAGLFNFPVWPARIALAFGASVMVAQCALDLFAALTGSASRASLDDADDR